MEDWIFDLVDGVKKLLSDATELDKTLDEIEANSPPTTPQLAKIEKYLGALCETLTNVGKVLREPAGPLNNLIQRLDGVSVSSDADGTIDRFLKSHTRMLLMIGVPREVIDRLLRVLQSEIDDGRVKLDEPRTITSIDGDALTASIEELGEIICKIHQNVRSISNIWDPELPRACVQGVMGSCLIIVDIAGAFTFAPVDITLSALFHAVMSTRSGYNRVRNSLVTIKSLWHQLTGDETLINEEAAPVEEKETISERHLKNLKKHKPKTNPIQSKKGGDKSGKSKSDR